MFILLKSTFNIVFSYNLLCQSVSRRIILIKNIFSAAFTSFACGSRGLDAVKQNALLRVAPIYICASGFPLLISWRRTLLANISYHAGASPFVFGV